MLRSALLTSFIIVAGTTAGRVWAVDAPESDASLAQQRVAAALHNALHNAPYSYDKHVRVTMKGDSVVLAGFVSSSRDLQEALRIARNAAEPVKLIDDLTIKEGGHH